MPTVSAFWWDLVTNWGDRLTPLLLKRFSQVDATWAPADSAEVVCVGSVLGNLVKPTYTGIVLGSGKLFEEGIVPPLAHIMALRGPLTARGVDGTFAIGDPGLLADELVKVNEKTHDLGIIPHWSDHRLERDPRFQKFMPVIIRSNHDPLDVIRTIGSCKKIVSSSLHGLILADAFNIPRRFEPTAAWSKEGGDFKVRDHCAAINLPFEIGLMQQADSNRVSDCKAALWDAFKDYASVVQERQ
jgi:pyruvyltransferase